VQDLTGQSAHFSPEWSLSGVAEYTDSVPGAANLDWFARGEWSYAGEQNISGRTNQNPNTVRNALDLANFRVGISSDEGWRFTAYVENAFDEAYCQTNLEQVAAGSLGVRDGAGGTLLRCPLGAPRTWGVKLNYDF